jgi:hypothetical protein
MAGAVAALAEPDLVGVLGPDHPDTLAARAVLDSWRALAGEATDE